MSEAYTDLLVHIRRRQDEASPYQVEASLSDGSFFFGHLHLDEEALLEAEGLASRAGPRPSGRGGPRATASPRQRRRWLDRASPSAAEARWSTQRPPEPAPPTPAQEPR